MADIKLYAPKLPTWEGPLGKVFTIPGDMGGATNCGVTFSTYQWYCKLKGIPAPVLSDFHNLPYDTWLDILKTMFWDKWQADKINNQSVAECLVEWFWGSGFWGIKIPQRLLGLTQDGIVGPATIAAVNAQNPETFHAQLISAKIEFINNLVVNNPSQQKFQKGWLRRINGFSYQS